LLSATGSQFSWLKAILQEFAESLFEDFFFTMASGVPCCVTFQNSSVG